MRYSTLFYYTVLSIISFTLFLIRHETASSQSLEWKQCDGYYSGAMKDIVQVDSTPLGYSHSTIYTLEKGSSRWVYTHKSISDIFHTMLSHNSELFAGGTNNIYYSSDKGNSWSTYGAFPLESVLYTINSLSYTSTALYAGSSGGVFICPHNTKTWVKILDSKKVGNVDALWAEDNLVIAHGDSGLFRSVNSGTSWQPITDNLLPEKGYLASSIIKHKGLVFISYNYFKGGIFVSEDLGLTWGKRINGLSELAILNLWSDGDNIFAKSRNGILYRLYGDTWETIHIPNGSMVLSVLPSGIYTHDNYINRSVDGGVSWQKLPVSDIVLRQLLPADNALIGTGNFSVIYVSDSLGNTSKRKIASWIGANEYGTVIYRNKNLYSATNTGIYKSSNLGDNWILTDPFSSQYPPPHYYPFIPFILSGYGLSAFFPEYYTTTDDNNWTRIGDSPGKAVRSGVLTESNFFLLVENSIMRRSPSGNYLDVTGTLSGNTIKDIKTRNGILFVSTTDGLWKSTDLAKTWQFIGLKGKEIESIEFLGVNIFVGEKKGEIFYSPDNGNTWKEIVKPNLQQNNYLYALGIYKKRLFASFEHGLFALNLPAAQVSQQLFPPNGFTSESDSITLTWYAAENAVSYHLQVNNIDDFTGTPSINKQFLTDTSYTLGNLKSGTTYYWRVKGIGLDGGEKTASKSDVILSENEWSPVYSFMVSQTSSITSENTENIRNQLAKYNEGIITLTLPEYFSIDNLSCSIGSLRGKVLSPVKITQNDLQIHIETRHLTNGLYTIMLSSNDKYFRYKCLVYDN